VPGVRALVLLSLAVACACGAAHATAAPSAETRPCGSVPLGIGWRVSATPSVRCPAARSLVRNVLGRRGCRTRCTVGGYVCTQRFLKIAARIQCVRGRRVVVARSFGY
jgi:hypothetical protein